MNILTLNLGNKTSWALYNPTRIKCVRKTKWFISFYKKYKIDKITSGEISIKKDIRETTEKKYKRFKAFLENILYENQGVDKIYYKIDHYSNKKFIRLQSIIKEFCKDNSIDCEFIKDQKLINQYLGIEKYLEDRSIGVARTLNHLPNDRVESDAIILLRQCLKNHNINIL